MIHITYFFLKSKLINLIEINIFNNINFWKITLLLNNFKYNLIIILIILIFFKKKQNIFYKNIFFNFLFLILIIFNVNTIIQFSKYGNQLTFFKKYNTALLNGIINVHTWLTFVCYSFIIIFILISVYLYTFKKMYLNIFFFKNFKKWFYFYSIFTAIFLGCFWSFQQLNWGGWWNWDLVELLSLIFFFTILYLIHNNFKNIFNIIFFKKIIIIFLSSLIIVRGNFLSSIHSFNESNFLKWFLMKFLIIFIFVQIFLTFTPKFKKIFLKNKLSYFNNHLYVIYFYVTFCLIKSLFFSNSGIDYLNFLQICFFLLGVFFLIYVNSSKFYKRKNSKNFSRIFHTFFLLIIIIIFFLKSGSFYFVFWSETHKSDQFYKWFATFFLSSDFFLETSTNEIFFFFKKEDLFYQFYFKNLNFFFENFIHIIKNNINSSNLFFQKYLSIQKNVIFFFYKNFFLTIFLLCFFLMFYRFFKIKIKIN